MGTIILTSNGFTEPAIATKFLNLVGNTADKRVAIITTAAENTNANKYVKLAHAQLTKMGFSSIQDVDLKTEPNYDFSNYDVIYVSGGNSFKLLQFAKLAHFKLTVENLLSRGGCYVGVSAGSIIMGPLINIADEVCADVNQVGLTDLTGLGIVPLIVLPHYTSEIEADAQRFEKKYSTKVKRLPNGSALVIKDGTIQKI